MQQAVLDFTTLLAGTVSHFSGTCSFVVALII